MKRMLSSTMIAVMVLFLVPFTARGRSLEEIRRTKEIRICVSPIHASICVVEPPGCRDGCQISGPAYDAAMAFAAFLGDQIVPLFRSVEWDEQFFNENGVTVKEDSYTPELLASGKCDIYPNNLTKNGWRNNKFDIVTMFPSRKMVIVKRSEKDRFKTLTDLAGKTAAIEKRTSYYTWLLEQNQGIFSENPVKISPSSVDEGLRAVMDGRADFKLLDADAAFWVIRNSYPGLDMAFAAGPTDELGWGFRKEDKDLQEAARTFFEQQRADENSQLNQIWRKYFGMSLTGFVALVSSISQ